MADVPIMDEKKDFPSKESIKSQWSNEKPVFMDDRRWTFNRKLLFIAAVTAVTLVTFYLGWLIWTVIS